MASSTFLLIVVSSFLLASHAFAKQVSFSRKALKSPYIETPSTPHPHSQVYIPPPPPPESSSPQFPTTAFLAPSLSPEFPPETPLPPSPYPPTPDTPLSPSPSPSSPYPPTPEFPLPPLVPELAAPPSTDGFTPAVYYPYPPPT